MAFKKNNPGCGSGGDCGCQCVYDRDNFNRSDDIGDMGSLWIDEVGTWAIISNELTASSANAYIKRDVEQPNSLPNIATRIRFRGENDGDQPRVLLDNVDSDNYLFLQATIGDPYGVLALGQREAGVETILSYRRFAFPAGEWHRIKLEWGKNRSSLYDSLMVTVYWSESGSPRETVLWYKIAATEPYAGLGTGDVTSQVKFDDWQLARTDDDCESIRPSCIVYRAITVPPHAAETDIGPDWEEFDGDFETQDGGNGLYADIDTGATALANFVLPVDIAAMRWRIVVNDGRFLVPPSGPDNTEAFLIFYWVDSDNYHYLWTDGVDVELREVAAGVETVLDSATITSESADRVAIILEVCAAGDNAVGTVMTDAEVELATVDAAVTTPATRHRLGFGGSPYGDTLIMGFGTGALDVAYSADHPDCVQCVGECETCTLCDGPYPCQLAVTFPDYDVDGVDVTQQLTETAECIWAIEATPGQCLDGETLVYIDTHPDFPTEYCWHAIGGTNAFEVVEWYSDPLGTDPIDCSATATLYKVPDATCAPDTIQVN